MIFFKDKDQTESRLKANDDLWPKILFVFFQKSHVCTREQNRNAVATLLMSSRFTKARNVNIYKTYIYFLSWVTAWKQSDHSSTLKQGAC